MKEPFQQVPDELLLDANLSLDARALYGVLKAFAYRKGRRVPGDAVALPTQAVIAETCRCSRTALRTYLIELQEAGWVVKTKTKYQINDAATVSQSRGDDARNLIIHGDTECSESDHSSRGRERCTGLELDKNRKPLTGFTANRAPRTHMIDGHNLGLDALCEECGIASNSPRIRQATTALNGHTARRVKGIREMLWDEVNEAAANGNQRAQDALAASEDPEKWERIVAAVIRRRALLHRFARPWVTLTPTALASMWVDIEAEAEQKKAGESAKDIAGRLVERAHQLREEGR